MWELERISLSRVETQRNGGAGVRRVRPPSRQPVGDHPLITGPGAAPGPVMRDVAGQGAGDLSPETFAIRRVVARRFRRTWRERACAAPCGGARVASPERSALATLVLWGRLFKPPDASARGTGAQRARARIAHSEHKLDRDLRARRCINSAHRRLTQAPPQRFSAPQRFWPPGCFLRGADLATPRRGLSGAGVALRIFLLFGYLYIYIAIPQCTAGP